MTNLNETYLVQTIGSLFDWAVAIAAYLLLNHTAGWVLVGMAVGADISRGLRLYSLEAKEKKKIQ